MSHLRDTYLIIEFSFIETKRYLTGSASQKHLLPGTFYSFYQLFLIFMMAA